MLTVVQCQLEALNKTEKTAKQEFIEKFKTIFFKNFKILGFPCNTGSQIFLLTFQRSGCHGHCPLSQHVKKDNTCKANVKVVSAKSFKNYNIPDFRQARSGNLLKVT